MIARRRRATVAALCGLVWVLAAGTASAHGEPGQGPLSGEPAVLHSLLVTKRIRLGRSVTSHLHYERSADAFTLDDGTGTVIVDPTDGAVRFGGVNASADTRHTLPTDDEDRRATIERVAEHAGVDPADNQRYREHRIEPGSEVTVLGTVRNDPESRYPRVEDGDRRLVVFEGGIEAVRASVASRVQYGATLGIGGFCIGTVGVLLTTGVW